ncbi:hypothetical protein BC832DRAFT_546432 [Gaertneriomyces semiglobifer]|nr:hypothetical protein BC832DRAFT_546432 [Gaertneriomyces semiglobifer]
MRILRASIHMSARAMRRAKKPSASFRASPIPAMAAAAAGAARSPLSTADMPKSIHTGPPVSSVLDALRSTTDGGTGLTAEARSALLSLIDEAEDEESNGCVFQSCRSCCRREDKTNAFLC